MNISITTSHTNACQFSSQSTTNGKYRKSYSGADGNGRINTSSEIISENNYYPFGLQHKGYNNYASANANDIAEKWKYNQGVNGKNFQGKEGKSFKVERQDEFGLNVDMTKYRMYDYALGRFTSVDPLADANPQESLTPYQYAYNSPIQYNDPYGDCPLCGFVVGAIVDYGLQVTKNAIEGKGLASFTDNIDGKSILLSAGAGGLSGGLSLIPKLKNASILIKEGVELATDTGLSVTTQALKDGEVSFKKTIIDVGIGKVIGKGVEKGVSNTRRAKQLKENINRQKNIARGKSNTTPKSKARVQQSEKKFDAYVYKRASASSATASGVVSTVIEENEKREEKGN